MSVLNNTCYHDNVNRIQYVHTESFFSLSIVYIPTVNMYILLLCKNTYEKNSKLL